ncbi:MAG: DUF1232 domain-containing protein [Phycisphaerae bacterium]|nr:DUF1232 domain-containing protein [Gemmatimonadaceae bacterium]
MEKDIDRESRREAARERAEASVQERLNEREKVRAERLLQRRAREREEDAREGRAQRGLFTGRGRRNESEHDDDNRNDDGDSGLYRSRRFRSGSDRGAPRTGAKRSVMKAITQLPSYLRLLLGLISDSRVSRFDRFFVIAAAAYIVSPIDFIPDIIPFLGEVDDVFLLMFALQRLVNNAGRSVVLKHWRGDPDEIHHLNFARIISAAGFFLPSQIKRRLFKMAGFGRKRGK